MPFPYIKQNLLADLNANQMTCEHSLGNESCVWQLRSTKQIAHANNKLFWTQ